MTTIEKRLDELETALQPGELPILIIYRQDGIYWTGDPIRSNYQAAIDPNHEESRIIEPAELEELKRTYRLIIVEYIPSDKYKPITEDQENENGN